MRIKKDVYKLLCIFWYTYLRYFPGGAEVKASVCNVRDLGSIPGLGRFPGEGRGYPLQYSDLENSMDWIVHGVSKSGTGLSDFHFHFSYTIKYYVPIK